MSTYDMILEEDLMDSLAPAPGFPSASMSTPALMNIRYLRPTSLQVFEECPHTWAIQNFHGVKQPPNKWSATGTSCHAAVETYLRMRKGERTYAQVVAAFNDAKACMEHYGFGHEVENLVKYIADCGSLLDAGWQTLAIEYKFKMPLFEGMPPVEGTMDWVLLSPTGVVMVRDHKTSRGYETIDTWSSKLQPLLYSAAVRRTWPEAREYRFSIGYLNIDVENPDWVITDEHEEVMRRRVWAAWQNMQIFARESSWPQTFGNACGFCPIKKECATMRASISNLKESFNLVSQERDPIEQLEWITAVEKAAGAFKDEAKERLVAEINENGGSMVVDGKEWYIDYRTTRKATASQVWDAIQSVQLDGEHSEMTKADEMQRFLGLFDDIFSAKVTGIDKLAKEAPLIGKAAASVMFDQKSGNPSIKSRKATKQIGA